MGWSGLQRGEGFPKSYRILKHNEFDSLFKSGKKLQDRHFILFFRQGLQKDSRIGLTVSKKVGNAVIRNLIKRRCREFYRLNRHPCRGIWDINIVAKKEAANLTTKDTEASLKRLFHAVWKNGVF